MTAPSPLPSYGPGIPGLPGPTPPGAERPLGLPFPFPSPLSGSEKSREELEAGAVWYCSPDEGKAPPDSFCSSFQVRVSRGFHTEGTSDTV